jgi:hypothetical protein
VSFVRFRAPLPPTLLLADCYWQKTPRHQKQKMEYNIDEDWPGLGS